LNNQRQDVFNLKQQLKAAALPDFFAIIREIRGKAFSLNLGATLASLRQSAKS
jgi:hypothetical protein